VAVKRLHVSDPRAFKLESTILRKLLSESHAHSHLITLLATYEQYGHQYLIFPWAERDLKNYWMQEDHEKHERFTIWLVRQCQGIAEALSQIHRYNTTSGTSIRYLTADETPDIRPFSANPLVHDPEKPRRSLTLSGRHGDIKPQNILWYHDSAAAQDLGTLKLADFGSTRFRDITRMPEEKRKSMAISRTYLSPECQMPDAKPSIQCDVWALGCVFLEFVCWYHAGHDGLQTFERRRNVGYASDSFFDIVRVSKAERTPKFDAIVKETVLEVSTNIAINTNRKLTCTRKEIAELRKLSRSDKGLTDLLNRIENNMLVVQNDSVLGTVQEADGNENSATHGLLEVPPEPRRRMSSGNIARKLGDTLQLIDPSRRNSTDSTRELTSSQSLPHRTSLQRPRE
jgi:serine/threonine protein kinase